MSLRAVLSDDISPAIVRLQEVMRLRSPSAAVEHLVSTYIDREIEIQTELQEQAAKLRDG